MVLGLRGSEAGDEGVTPVLSPLGCGQGSSMTQGISAATPGEC